MRVALTALLFSGAAAYAQSPTAITDPTALTTQQIVRELLHQRELFDAKLLSIDTRLGSMDKAQELFQSNLTRIPTETDRAVGRLQELHNEKFRGIDVQFKERDTRVEQTAKDGKVSIDAALSAAEKAVAKQNESNALAIAKQEAAFTKQIDQQYLQNATSFKSLDDKIADLKTQLSTISGRSGGVADSWGYLVGIIGASGVIFGGFIAFNNRRRDVTPPVTVPPGYVLVPATPPAQAMPPR